MKSYQFLHGALLYQTTCLELEPGVHSVSTVNIAPLICWKKKCTLSQRKGWISIHLFFRHVRCTDFQITTSFNCSTFTDLSEWCYYFEVVLFLEGFFCQNETRKRKKEKQNLSLEQTGSVTERIYEMNVMFKLSFCILH